jgi:hypothetical protein
MDVSGFRWGAQDGWFRRSPAFWPSWLRCFSITLAPYVGEPVTIRYDPRDLAEIRVYHRDKFLCRAESPDIAAVTVSLQDLQAARNQRRRELRQQLTARRSLVELLTQPKPESARGQTTRRKTPAADTTNRAATRLKLYRENTDSARPVGAQSWSRSSNWTPDHPAHRDAWSTSRSPGSTAGSSNSPMLSVVTGISASVMAAPGLGKTLSAHTYPRR